LGDVLALAAGRVAADDERITADLAEAPVDLPPPRYVAPFSKQVGEVASFL
jgi:hypothetical protein